eukprot:6298769-Lingulodinium_polyedra.AAC.1
MAIRPEIPCCKRSTSRILVPGESAVYLWYSGWCEPRVHRLGQPGNRLALLLPINDIMQAG